MSFHNPETIHTVKISRMLQLLLITARIAMGCSHQQKPDKLKQCQWNRTFVSLSTVLN